MLWWLSKQIWFPSDRHAHYLHIPRRGTIIVRLDWGIPPPMRAHEK